MVKEITFLKGNLCIYEGFMDVLYILGIGMKEKPQNEPRFKTDFMLNFAMYSADLICVNGSKKKFHEIIYLSLFIHNIN